MIVRNLLSYLIAPVLFSVAVSGLIRGVLYFLYPDYFVEIPMLSLMNTFIHGVRFDLSITTIVYALVFLITIALVWFGLARRLSSYLLWIAYGLISTTWLLYISSVVYFGEVHRHISTELLYVTQDIGFIFALISSGRILWLLFGIALLIITALLWKKLIINRAIKTPEIKGWKNKAAFSLVGIFLAILFVRGMVLDGKTISIADAYALGNERQANLAMNGAFSIVHNTRRASKNKGEVKYYGWEEFKELRNKVDLAPFQRVIPAFETESKQKNIVFVLLESWSANYIDALAGTEYNATPFMDGIIKKSKVWPNTFSAGQRSIEGVQAILASIPLLEGRQTLGWGLEQNRMTSLAKEANSVGYHTVMMQTSSRRSFHMDAIASLVGFSEYYAMEDFPMLREYPVGMPDFGWDYEGLMYLSDYLHSLNGDSPFFAFFFTGSSHEPFPDAGSEFHIYPHGEDDIKSYLNTLYYSDWSLKQFMKSMEKHPGYNDTVFIFMADHVLKAATEDKVESFKIPLFIYSPSGDIAPSTDKSFATQYDLAPTLASLMSIDKSISTFGRSLLTESPLTYDGALSKQGNNYVWFEENGWAAFDSSTGEVRDYAGDLSERDAVLTWNKVRLQYVNALLKDNSWVEIDKVVVNDVK